MGITEFLYLVLVSPSRGLSLVTARRPLGWALLLMVIYSLVATAVMWRSPAPMGMAGQDITVMHMFGSPLILLIPAIFTSLAGLFLTAAIWHGLAFLLGGKGTYLGLVCGLAFAMLPTIFMAPLTFFALFVPGTVILLFLSNLAINIWIIALDILAIRYNYGLTTLRAAIVFSIPIVALIALGLGLALLLILAGISSFGIPP